MRPTTNILATALLALTLLPAQAHDLKSKHGGRIVDAGDHHVEMAAKDGTVEVYVTDHDDRPVNVAAYKGVAILVIDGKSQRIVLAPVDGRLTGSGAATAATKGVVQLTTPAGKPCRRDSTETADSDHDGAIF